ncbi:MAG: helix-turn-helix domain-containing protein [Rhizobiaceae bacterium]
MIPKRVKVLIRKAQTIKSSLAENGFTLLGVDRHYKLPKGTAGDTLRNPNQRGEKAIASALGVKPQTLWPSRYNAKSGKRLSPQPSQNYDRPPTIRQRRKLAGART